MGGRGEGAQVNRGKAGAEPLANIRELAPFAQGRSLSSCAACQCFCSEGSACAAALEPYGQSAAFPLPRRPCLCAVVDSETGSLCQWQGPTWVCGCRGGAGAAELLERWPCVRSSVQYLAAGRRSTSCLQPFCSHLSNLDPTEYGEKGRISISYL
jgi:hypothetical protein